MMRALLRTLFVVVAIAASCAGPDRFGVGANATQSDWMRADSSTLLANDTGIGYGVGVWAEWDLRKQTQPIAFDWPDRPPFYLANGLANKTQPVLQPPADDDKPDRIGQSITAAKALDGMQPATQIILLVLGLAAVLGIIIVAHLRTKRSPKP